MYQKIKRGVSAILKSKWFLVLLVGSTIIGIILPQTVSAAWWEYLIPGWNIYVGIRDIGSALGDIGLALLNAILIAAGSIVLTITGALFGLGKELLGAVTSGTFFWSYTKMDNPVIKEGWTQVRDLANMFIVLGFVVIGVATALRLREYEAQKTLVPLIIVAILVNFSLVICGIAIDASNLLMKHFFQTGGPGKALFDTITKQVGALYSSKTLLGNPLNTLGAIIGVALYNIFGFFILMFYALLFLARYAALWILVALSPLAFVCYVFNFTKPYFNFWIKQFTQWCLVGVFGAFFIYLGDAMTEGILSDTRSHSWGTALASLTPLNPVLWLPLIFLLVGFMATLQSGAIGAGIITNIGKAAVSKAKGAAGKALKESRIGERAKDISTAAMERAHLVKVGTLARDRQTRAKDALDRAKADYATNPDRVIADAGRRGGMKPEDIQARAVVAAEEGRLNLTNRPMVANYRAAAVRGMDIKNAEKKDPRLARFNEREIQRLMTPAGGGLARPQAEQQVVDNAYTKLNVGDIRNLSESAMNMNFVNNTSARKISKAGEEMSQSRINHLQTNIAPQIQTEMRRLAPGGVTPATGTPAHAKYQELTEKFATISAL